MEELNKTLKKMEYYHLYFTYEERLDSPSYKRLIRKADRLAYSLQIKSYESKNQTTKHYNQRSKA